MNARAVIAEDEITLAEELRELLATLWPELAICAMARDGVEALRQLESEKPDILFLDIEMPQVSGLEVARQASGRCHVVFVTAFDHYAVDAFEQGAVDYVRKPISAARLVTTISRLKEKLREPPAGLQPLLRRIAQSAPAQRPYLRWINASRGDEIRLVTVEEVLYFKAEDKYTRVVTATGESLIRKPIKELVAELDPAMFLQIHRSTLVNSTAIAAVRRGFGGHLELKLKDRPESLAVAESCNHLFRQM
jgi:DNA-binding LytR/AlgR family response regulator